MRGKETHIPQLDGLRGLAVILVLLAHSTMVFVRIPFFTGWLDRFGSLGVQIFFVLSGFLITRILLDTKESQNFFSSFFVRRGLRIYPLYYATLAFVIFSGVVHQHNVHWWVYGLYVSNLVYGHTVQPAPLSPVWSLAVEEQFYLVWPFVIWIAGRNTLKRLLILLMIGAVTLRFTEIFYPHNTLLQMDGLAAGALIACCQERIRFWRIPAAVAACLMPLGMGFSDSAGLNALSQTIQVISAAGLLIVLLEPGTIPRRLFRFPALRYIGTISYGIYLLHSFVFSAFLRTRFVTGVIDSGSLAGAVSILILEFAIVVAVASASFYLFERPSLRLKRHFPSVGSTARAGNLRTSFRQPGPAQLSDARPVHLTYNETVYLDRAMVNVGYDAQAFLSANGGTGKGAQLRNLIGPFLDRFLGFASVEPNASGMPLIREGFAGHNLWQQFSLPFSLRRHNIDVFLAPYNVAPLFLPWRLELILVLHDTILMKGFRKPDLRGRLMDVYRRLLIPRSVNRAKIVLTVSEHARSEILSMFPRANVRVIPCSIPRRWFSLYPIEGRSGYVLMVTSGAPHKNAAGGLRGYAEYARRAGQNAKALKVVGLGSGAAHRSQVSELGISHFVSFLPFLSEDELLALYRDAGVLLFPSFAEGFGIPLLEAMATGTPAIAARTASLPEVGGAAAKYFDPSNDSDIADTLEHVLGDQQLRESMAALGFKRAQTFHPDVVTKQVVAFWHEVAGVSHLSSSSEPVEMSATGTEAVA